MVINNRRKFQCCVANNKAYRRVRISYVNCMLKLNFNGLAVDSVCVRVIAEKKRRFRVKRNV